MQLTAPLPESKRDFPKCLYLDQNKWITLARAVNGIGDSHLAPVAELLQRAVLSGKAIVPLSNIHILETSAPRDQARRKRLAETMVQLSANWVIRPYHVMQLGEVRKAIAAKLGLVGDLFPSGRPYAVCKGILRALDDFTIEGPDAAEVEAHIQSLEFTLNLLAGEETRAAFANLRTQEIEDAQRLTDSRKAATSALGKNELLQLDVRNLITDEEFGRDIKLSLKQLGCPLSTMNPHLASFRQHLEFIRAVPTANVYLTLVQERFNDLDRRTDRNDFKDIGFLRVAVPYANIVVAERYWSAVCNRSGLDKAYETIVCSDLERLPEILEAEGCLT
jgi:hypothetical protein